MRSIAFVIFWIADLAWGIDLIVSGATFPRGWIPWIAVTMLAIATIAFPLVLR